MSLRFAKEPARFDPDAQAVRFVMRDGERPVRFVIGREALQELQETESLDAAGSERAFEQNRDRIERAAAVAYALSRAPNEAGDIALSSADITEGPAGTFSW